MAEQHAKHDEIVKILLKSVNNEQLNSDEQQLLDSWLAESPHNKKVFEDVSNAPLLEKEVKALVGYDQRLLWKQIERGIHGNSKKGRLIFFFRWNTRRIAAVASIVIILSIGAYFIFNKSTSPAKVASEKKLPAKPADLAPGTDGAILQLADGSSIVLDQAANGALTKDITKKDGQVIYNNSTPLSAEAPLEYNTITTPNKRHYTAILSDGSIVWLNAASSIKYPTVFSGNERRIILSGEAFFEVAKDAKKPFRVQVNGMEVEAVGTSFNINSYSDETIKKTTLTEGLVKVWSNDQVAFLRPGQQAQLTKSGAWNVVSDVDLDKELAWKNSNSFSFQDDDIETIMRQISRWYDVQIKYEGKVTNKYDAVVSRSLPVSSIFRALEHSGGVHFVLATEGGRNVIIVKPKP
jgi:transmembrane sensor